jgi:4-hydroxybenzoate polyprenyltransferase
MKAKGIDINKLISKLDYFFVLRPMLFFPGWSTLLAGYFIAKKGDLFLQSFDNPLLDPCRIFILMFSFAAAMGASFLLNQLKDIVSDRENDKLYFISEGYISKKAALLEVVFLIAAALISAWYISLSVLIVVVVFIVLTGYMYNYRPFTMKDRPWMSLIANSAMGFFAFAIGWLGANDFSQTLFFDMLPYLFFNTALYFYTTLPDIEGDRKSEKHTLAVDYGIKPLLWGAFLLYILSVLSALYLKDVQALFFIALSLPFFVMTVIKLNVESSILTTKFSILFYALAICFKFPIYFLLMVVLFFFSRLYFKKRFKVNYPSFGKE